MTSEDKVMLAVVGVGVIALLAILLTRSQGQSQALAGPSSYNNAETWEFTRDPKTGRIASFTIHRAASAQ